MAKKLDTYVIIFFFLAAIFPVQYTCAQQSNLQQKIQDSLKKQIDSLTNPGYIITNNECLSFPLYVKRYYMQNNYQPAWINKNGVSGLCDSLISLLKQSYSDGLDPDDYHLTLMESLYSSLKHTDKNKIPSSVNTSFYLELFLTDAFITYTSDLYAGHFHTENENVEWEEHIKEINPADSLKKAIENNSMTGIAHNFSCVHPGYIALKKILQKINNANRYNTPDTSVGSEDSLNTIILNMERWRWLPHSMNKPYIMVNIADFTMGVVDSDRKVMSMKIIVGKTYTRTPLFHAKMTYLVLNPWWEIPQSIGRKEILEEEKKNKNYLTKNHIDVYENWSQGARQIPADSINWDSVSATNLTYRFRQEPGPGNALGRIKFMFPNKYNVYLHGTPDRELFLKNVRTFSHGCIRIEKPTELAAYLLKSDSAWTKKALTAALDTAKDKIVLLPKPINVYICYWTARVNSAGRILFSPDIYEYDKRLLELMQPEDVTGQ